MLPAGAARGGAPARTCMHVARASVGAVAAGGLDVLLLDDYHGTALDNDFLDDFLDGGAVVVMSSSVAVMGRGGQCEGGGEDEGCEGGELVHILCFSMGLFCLLFLFCEV